MFAWNKKQLPPFIPRSLASSLLMIIEPSHDACFICENLNPT